jgi:membrane associated rhomboid family serine protease
MVTRIIIINVSVFVLVNLLKIFLFLFNGGQLPSFYWDFVHFFSMSSDWKHILMHPWVIITSMFLHEGFWHIFWNMLFMYWFGRIVGDFIGNQRILPIYLLGGIAGGIMYYISANLLYNPGGVSYALGASAGVMAIVAASGTIAPDYVIRLLFIGDVKLKYIVMVLVFLDFISIANNINTGGHVAHIGGALFGFIFIRQLREGNDWSLPVNKILERINSFFGSLVGQTDRRKGPRVVYRNKNKTGSSRRGNAASDKEDLSYQEKLDAILDKIKRSGYESLSEEEKEFLFNASKK